MAGGVPFNPVPTVMPTGGNAGAYQRIDANPAAFGAGTGEALQRFGSVIAQTGNVVQDAINKRKAQSNDLMVMDASSQLSRALADRYTAFGNMQGKSAQDGLPTYNNDVQAAYDSVAATMPDPETKLAFARSNMNMRDSYFIKGGEHANTQFQTWQKDSTTALSADMQQQAVLAVGDPKAMEGFVRRGADAVLQYNINQGIDPNIANQEVRKYVGGSYLLAVQSKLDAGDPIGAQKIFDQYKGQMDADSIVRAQSALAPAVRAARSESGADAAFSSVGGHPNAPQQPRAEYVVGDSHAGGTQSAVHLPGYHTDGISILSPASSTKPNAEQLLQRVPNNSRVYMYLGTNDARSPSTFDHAAVRAAQLVQEAKARGIEVVWVGPPQNGQNWDSNGAVLDQKLNAAVTAAGGTYKSSRGMAQDQINPSDPMHIHFTPGGYSTIFNGVRGDGAGPQQQQTPRFPAYFSPQEIEAAQTVDPTLQQVMTRASQIAGIRLYVPPETGGKRNQEQQNELVTKGWSQTRNSEHLYGNAIDIWPVRPDGTPDPKWDEGYQKITGAMRQAAQELGVQVTWGGDWHSFVDKPHWQLSHGQGGRLVSRIDGPLASVISSAAEKYGVPADALQRMAILESGGNPHGPDSGAGAKGLFQFVPGTAQQYGLTNPYDPTAASDAAARLYRDNAQILAKGLGRVPEPWEVYLAHQQGAGGALKLLQNPNASAASLLGQAAVTQNGGRADMTAEQFAGLWRNKFNGASGTLGGGTVAAGEQPPAQQQVATDSGPVVLPTVPNTGGPTPPPDVSAPPMPTAAPVEYGMPEKGAVVAQAMKDYGNDPQQLAGVLAVINKRYTEFNTQTAAERDQVKSSVTDIMAAARDGATDLQFPTDRVRYLFPPHEAEQMISEFQITTAANKALQGIPWATPAELADMSKDINSGFGPFSDTIRVHVNAASTGGEPGVATAEAYRIQKAARDQFNRLSDARTKALTGENADPAAYVRNEPTVAAAWSQLTAPIPANASPEEKSGLVMQRFDQYASAALAVQHRLGLADEQTHIMSRDEAQQATQSIMTSPNPADLLRTRQTMAGKYANNYFTDVSGMGKLPTGYQLVGLLPDAKAASLLGRALHDQYLDPKTKLADQLGPEVAGQPGAASTAIDSLIDGNSSLQNYLASQTNSNGPGALQQNAEIVDAVKTLAYADRFYNHETSIKGAADYALNALLDHMAFMPNGGAVIPKENAEQTQANARFVIDNLTDASIMPPRVGVGGIAQPTVQEYVDHVKATPLWVTNQLSTGLYLKGPNNELVRRRDGSLVEIPFGADVPGFEFVHMNVVGTPYGAVLGPPDLIPGFLPKGVPVEQPPTQPATPAPRVPVIATPYGGVAGPPELMGPEGH